MHDEVRNHIGVQSTDRMRPIGIPDACKVRSILIRVWNADQLVVPSILCIVHLHGIFSQIGNRNELLVVGSTHLHSKGNNDLIFSSIKDHLVVDFRDRESAEEAGVREVVIHRL